MNFGQWLERTAPAWWSAASTDARLVLQAIGAELDLAKAALREARRLWLLSLTPDGLLELHGQIRRLPRYPGESNDVYRARLLRALQLYREAGRKSAIVAVLKALGFPTGDVVELYQEGTRTLNGTWFLNGEVILNGGLRRFEYDLSLPISEAVPGPSTAILGLMRSEARRWAPAWARLRNIRLVLAPFTDAADAPTDAPMTITFRRFSVLDGSWDLDGSHTLEPIDTWEVDA